MDPTVYVLLLTVSLCCLKICTAECNVVYKAEWNGLPPTMIEYQVIPVEYVIVHHTATTECSTEVACNKSVQNLQRYFLETLKYRDMGYNFVIGGDGRIYEGAGWHKIGAHTKGYNDKSIGIALIGNFDKKLPNGKQLSAIKQLLQCGVEIGELDTNYKLLAARQVRSTISPGEKFLNELKTWPHFVKTP